LKRRDVETKLNRISRLLYRLMSGSTVESSKLAEEFGVNIRTVERYIEELRMAGVPITSSHGRHRMAKSMLDIDYDYTLSLTAREKKILLLMVVLAKNYFGSLYSKDLQNIESQIINSLSLDSFYSKYAYYVQCYSFLQPKVEEVDIRVVEAIEEGIANHVVIQFNYHNPNRGWQKYTVEPYRIVFSDEHWYLFCRDVERNFKLFLRLSRIHAPVISTEQSFSMPTRQEIETMLSKVWGTHFSDREYEIKIWFSKRVARKIEETTRHSSQKLEYNDDGSVVCHVKVCGYKELISWVLSWGSDAKILAPEWIKRRLRKEIEKMVILYENDKSVSI